MLPDGPTIHREEARVLVSITAYVGELTTETLPWRLSVSEVVTRILMMHLKQSPEPWATTGLPALTCKLSRVDTISATHRVSPSSDCTWRWPRVLGKDLGPSFLFWPKWTWTSPFSLTHLRVFISSVRGSSMSTLPVHCSLDHNLSFSTMDSSLWRGWGLGSASPPPPSRLCTGDRESELIISSLRNFHLYFCGVASLHLLYCFQIVLELSGFLYQLQTQNSVVRENEAKQTCRWIWGDPTQLCWIAHLLLSLLPKSVSKWGDEDHLWLPSLVNSTSGQLLP